MPSGMLEFYLYFKFTYHPLLLNKVLPIIISGDTGMKLKMKWKTENEMLLMNKYFKKYKCFYSSLSILNIH